MMLPSGNDAAQSLALYFGHLLHFLQNKKLSVNDIKQFDANINVDDFKDDDPEPVED